MALSFMGFTFWGICLFSFIGIGGFGFLTGGGGGRWLGRVAHYILELHRLLVVVLSLLLLIGWLVGWLVAVGYTMLKSLEH